MSGLNVEDLFGENLAVRGTAPSSRKSGDEQLIVDCPSCEKRSKCYVNATTGFWFCYSCSAKGDLVRLVEVVYDCSRVRALGLIQKAKNNVPLSSLQEIRAKLDALSAPKARPPKQEPLALPESYKPVWDPKRASPWVVPTYLVERGYGAARGHSVLAQYGVGWCTSGRYANRIIVPAYQGGKLVNFQARTTTNSMPKYLNPPTERGKHVLGLDQAVGSDTVILVEGPFDVLGCARSGLPHSAVALLGKTISHGQVALLRQSGFEKFIVMLDPTARPEAYEVAMRLVCLHEVRIAVLPKGTDPGDANPRQLHAAIREAHPLSFADKYPRACS